MVQEIGHTTEFSNFIKLVRLFLRDIDELNRTHEGEETDDRLIALCVYMTIDDYNTAPPVATGNAVTFQTFPSLWMLLLGTVSKVLLSSLLLRIRNFLLVQGEAVRLFGGANLSAGRSVLPVRFRRDRRVRPPLPRLQVIQEFVGFCRLLF